jgi:hypothetical protein
VLPTAEHSQAVVDAAFTPPPKSLDILDKPRLALEREREVLQKALWEEERALGRANYWYFFTQILFPDSWEQHYTEEFHKPIADALQNLETGQDLWIFLQREGRKTYTSDLGHNIWLIIRDADIRILLVGAREQTVKPFARLIKSAFQRGTPGFEKFQATYPEFVVDGRGGRLWKAFEFTVPNRTKALADPTFRASYLGVSGAGWRCDVLNFDDPIERRSVFTPEGSDKALGQMLDLLPLVDSTSKYQNIKGSGTRWAYHDPYGKLIGEAEAGTDGADALDRFKKRNVKVIMMHAFESATEVCTHCPPHIVEQWPHGHPVSPETEEGIATCFPIHTRESLVEKLEQYRIDPNKGEAMWWHQYQNVCKSPASQKFRDFWFELIIDKPSWPVSKRRVLAIDSADKDFQKKGLGDFMVAIFADFDDIGRLCARHGLRSNKWTREEFLKQIVSWCQGTGWWPQVIAKEKFATDTFLTDIGRSFRSAMHPVHCVTVSRPVSMGTMVKKFDWIVETLQGPMERGEVVFGSAFPQALRARAQYEGTNLGQVSHDDVMDTLALFFDPDIRVLSPNPGYNSATQMQPMPLALYDNSGGPPVLMEPAKPRTQTARTEILLEESGFNNINWNPNGAPQLFRFDDM